MTVIDIVAYSLALWAVYYHGKYATLLLATVIRRSVGWKRRVQVKEER